MSPSNESLGIVFSKKACVTLGGELSTSIRPSSDRYQELCPVLRSAKLFLRVTWLNAIAGAWCASHCMHNSFQVSLHVCVQRATLHFRHYIQCALLWQLAVEQLGPELSVAIEERLSFVAPSYEKLQRLALVHVEFCSCRNDPLCVDASQSLALPATVQKRAGDFVRHAKHLVQ